MAEANSSSSISLMCSTMEPFIYIFLSFNIVNVIQLPLFAFILYLFYLQWRVQHSASTMPHSDFLTLHMTVINMISILGSVLCLVSYNGSTKTLEVGIKVIAIAWYSGMFLHVFTCLDQYLAVVHPVTYMSLKQGKRHIKMRLVCIVLAWWLSFTGAMMYEFIEWITITTNLVVLSSIWISIIACSLIVLRILRRPRPGTKDERALTQQKRRAFYVILIILGVLSSKFVWSLLLCLIYMSPKMKTEAKCFMETAEWWFNIPSNMILPVMFLLKQPKREK